MTKGVIIVPNLAALSKDISPFRVAKNDPLYTHIQDHLRTEGGCSTSQPIDDEGNKIPFKTGKRAIHVHCNTPDFVQLLSL